MLPLQQGQGAPFMGRLVNITRDENGIYIPIPFDMLNDAGIKDESQVEVWALRDGTISFRIATICELCGRGAKLYEIDMGSIKRKICAEDYKKLLGVFPQELPTEQQ
ncbi:hypothetical protein [Bacillus pseudomycoides]|uniref:hypothetical protein n=1 Tax=Bacillus pseudomycoides TaxID=64104 RepID=UPI000BEDDF35|nr:hypothetical protein [Bacillus pseudomycoides]PDY48441.1 hypothetical protein CON79_04285 [Bacillus pseudomycoides]PHB44244.1 hypothetical protein COE83_18980 [Bacillus pseudomycoides]